MEPKPTHLQLGQYHIPALDAGDYTITVDQTLSDGDGHTQTYQKTLDFTVQGDRFIVRPTDVQAVFPPANGLGKYDNVLPQIILKRSTLPWERDPKAGAKYSPWMALLSLEPHEFEVMGSGTAEASETARIEAQNGYALPLSELEAGGLAGKEGFEAAEKSWPGITIESTELEEDRASVIFVKKRTLAPLIGSLADREKLTHIRQGTDDQGILMGEETGVLLGNRLPRPGATTVVHLVSIENRYGENGFDYGTAEDEDPIPLVSLYSWTFNAISPKYSFRGLLLHLNQTPIFHVSAEMDLNLDMHQLGVPAALRDLFASVGQPLSEGSLTQNTDRAEKEVELKDAHFIIGNSGQVYDQAGYKLFRLAGVSEDADELEDSVLLDKLRAGIAAHHFSQFPELPTEIEVKTLTIPHWWLEDTVKHRRYYIRHEGEYVDALMLELDHSPVLRLPETGNEVADEFLHQGFAPLPHHLRRGGKTVSWYRGPLTTSEKRISTIDENIFEVQGADQLVIYHKKAGMFDITYAAAWELGRLLALQSKQFSVGLHRWRRTHARAAIHAESHNAHLHLPKAGVSETGTTDFPPVLREWLDHLWKLEGIPYNYLVPDDRMLPPESLRFFTLDPDWMACLVHGAFGVGAHVGTDHWSENHDDHPVNHVIDNQNPITGFLLKSEVVMGWPDMQIEVMAKVNGSYYAQEVPVTTRRLANDVMLVLFEGEAQQITFSLKPDALHSGFEKNMEASGYLKYLRDQSGQAIQESIPVELDANRIVNVSSLYTRAAAEWAERGLTQFSSGHFALALMEGAEKVIYNRIPIPPVTTAFNILPGTQLVTEQRYYSEDGQYYLVFQEDGNLVMCQTDDNLSRFESIWWREYTYPVTATAAFASNGNLVIRNATGEELWKRTGRPGAHLGVMLAYGSFTFVDDKGQITHSMYNW